MKFSFTLLFSGIFLAYILHSIWSIAQLFIPPSCLAGQQCIPSFLSGKHKLQLYAFVSVRKSPSVDREVRLLHEESDLNYKEPFKRNLIVTVPESVRRNGSLFLHVWVAAADWGKWEERRKPEKWSALLQDPFAVHTMARVTKLRVPQASAFKLLSNSDTKESSKSKEKMQEPVMHLKPFVEVSLLTDISSLPARGLPAELAYLLRLAPDGSFLPILNYNFLSDRMADLIQVTKETVYHNLTLAYTPIGVGKLRLMLHLENGIRSLKEFGFSSKDVDDVKGIFADTNIYLLCTTIFVAAVHLLFDFLALKNDVSFWRRTRSMEGLSSRTVLWRAFSQAVVFLYLLDENTSLLVLVPAGLTALVELWKVKKCFRIKFTWHGMIRGPQVASEAKTQEFDQQCMTYLKYFLWPACIVGAIYSLLYEPHKGWYSWTVHSLVRGVYAFGFLFMLPQLFVNYKLRSVAHLPWRAFMYKAFNTFIDDLFAFTISMPTAHRVACFRDDAVFLVYLYQRWLYPVDKKRQEGIHGEQLQDENHAKQD